MISELRIEHLGVIASACVQPGPGFTALTGETGAGKTIVLTALEMLLGGRVDASIADGASIQGVWEVAARQPRPGHGARRGGHADDGEVLLGRTASNGRLRAFAGGRMVPASLLAEIGERLVTVHGQASQQRLRNPSAQRQALDRFGGPAPRARSSSHRAGYRRWQDIAERLRTAREGQQQSQQRIVFLTSALEEIERVDPQPGETPALQTEHHRLANLADLTTATAAAAAALSGDEDDTPGATDLLHAAARDLNATDDPELRPMHERLVALAEEAADVARDLSAFADGLQDEPGRLEWINQRLHDLGVLRSRYGATEDDVLAWSQQAAAELSALERGQDLQALAAEEQAARGIWITSPRP